MSHGLGYLFAAFTATWAGFFAYLWFMQRLLADSRRRLRWLEEDQRRHACTAEPANDLPAP